MDKYLHVKVDMWLKYLNKKRFLFYCLQKFRNNFQHLYVNDLNMLIFVVFDPTLEAGQDKPLYWTYWSL